MAQPILQNLRLCIVSIIQKFNPKGKGFQMELLTYEAKGDDFFDQGHTFDAI
jgi:hypothetical protein